MSNQEFREKKENLKQKINKQMDLLHSASNHQAQQANVWYEMGQNMALVKDMIQLPISYLSQNINQNMDVTMKHNRALSELHHRVKKLEGQDTEAARSLVQMSREGNKKRKTGGRKKRKTGGRKKRKTRKRKTRKRKTRKRKTKKRKRRKR